jgi:hypothetical protein
VRELYRELFELEGIDGALDRVHVLVAILEQLLVVRLEEGIAGAACVLACRFLIVSRGGLRTWSRTR